MTLYYDPEKKQLTPSGVAFVAGTFFLGPLGGAIVGAILDKFSQPGSLEGDDAENIRTIIQAGNENNVDEMEIELDREVVQGLDLKAFESMEGVTLTLGQKGKSRYKMKVKYKQ
jgi:hypothetical protein